ncbi:hypothetical protein DV515_00018473 [Chloebia gouldiae]|uniref:Uncharacterized protein n=1 Tax=Chloebia gouldiae TaxID=44316 RepID=A0A3L8Q7N9_CHLGU|nr:hypothetical protein DV515_00018473 [Chloebia gouldiae]
MKVKLRCWGDEGEAEGPCRRAGCGDKPRDPALAHVPPVCPQASEVVAEVKRRQEKKEKKRKKREKRRLEALAAAAEEPAENSVMETEVRGWGETLLGVLDAADARGV